jgi:hypothetical protein
MRGKTRMTTESGDTPEVAYLISIAQLGRIGLRSGADYTYAWMATHDSGASLR